VLRFGTIALVLAASGCNCSADTSGLSDPDATFSPRDATIDPPDALGPAPRDAAMVDAGSIDAGRLDASTSPCLTASDCRGPAQPSVLFCPDSRYSCIGNECVWECNGPRTCTIDASECAVCDGLRTCPGMRCGLMMSRGRIEDVTTGCFNLPGTNTPFAGAEVNLFSTARPCSTGIELTGSPSFVGAFLEHPQGDIFAFFPALGGRCSGVQAPTGAIRFIFSCPACQFVVGP